MTQKSMSFKDITIVTVEKIDYRINIWGLTENEAVNRTKNANLSEKSKQL